MGLFPITKIKNSEINLYISLWGNVLWIMTDRFFIARKRKLCKKNKFSDIRLELQLPVWIHDFKYKRIYAKTKYNCLSASKLLNLSLLCSLPLWLCPLQEPTSTGISVTMTIPSALLGNLTILQRRHKGLLDNNLGVRVGKYNESAMSCSWNKGNVQMMRVGER